LFVCNLNVYGFFYDICRFAERVECAPEKGLLNCEKLGLWLGGQRSASAARQEQHVARGGMRAAECSLLPSVLSHGFDDVAIHDFTAAGTIVAKRQLDRHTGSIGLFTSSTYDRHVQCV